MGLTIIKRSQPCDLLTRQEAAQYLGNKTQTLAKWASTHRYDLPFIKVGKSVRYRKHDLDEFLHRNTFGRCPELGFGNQLQQRLSASQSTNRGEYRSEVGNIESDEE